ncbi:hypothetical protein ABVV53_13935 [Novosphingobium sp. RD2P27]|uniref:Uncharacterized protein n=1 Tax=Novosphingobium kalidii TaxID=3230299 RepID=A0ABV2D3U8_9SPHN
MRAAVAIGLSAITDYTTVQGAVVPRRAAQSVVVGRDPRFRVWKKIEDAEIANARAGSRCEKFVLIEEMVKAATTAG